MTAKPDPVSGQYDLPEQAPIDGDQVRLSARVYNYSTGEAFTNWLVQFYVIKYNSSSNTEIGPRQLIGSTNISLPPRGAAPAQIIWNTKGLRSFGHRETGLPHLFDPNYDNCIDEIYLPEDPTKQYASGLLLGLDPGQNDEG
jgi:hypothetical protein